MIFLSFLLMAAAARFNSGVAGEFRRLTNSFWLPIFAPAATTVA
jgi:hypothetical protein